MVVVFLCLNAKAELQYYDSKCTDDQVTIINGSSLISWGTIYPDKITLNKIKSGNNGYIEFQIEGTDLVEVSLTDESNSVSKFGFKFKANGEAVIQNASIELTGIPQITYVYADVFKVEKCNGQVCYYKNNNLLYCHCLDDISTVFVHTTDVTTASNTRLKLEFESDSGCAPSGRLALVKAANETGLKKLQVPKELSMHKVVLANVYTLKGRPIKQFRIRINKEGEVSSNHDLQRYYDKKYKIVFKEIK